MILHYNPGVVIVLFIIIIIIIKFLHTYTLHYGRHRII